MHDNSGFIDTYFFGYKKVIDKGVTFYVDQYKGILLTNKKKLNYRIKNKLYYVDVCINGIKSTHCVHILMAKAYVHNPLNYTHVKHKNEITTNNLAYNLEWVAKRPKVARKAKRATKRQYFETFTSQKQMREYFINIGLDVEVAADGDVLVFRDGKLCPHFLILHTSKNVFNVQVLNIPITVTRIEMQYPALHFFDNQGNEFID